MEAEFIDHFGSFNGKNEKQRWQTLVECIGLERAQEIAAWAERKEIHMINRGGLMDSLETAAKKQTNGTASNGFFYPILYHCGGVAGPNFEMPT